MQDFESPEKYEHVRSRKVRFMWYNNVELRCLCSTAPPVPNWSDVWKCEVFSTITCVRPSSSLYWADGQWMAKRSAGARIVQRTQGMPRGIFHPNIGSISKLFQNIFTLWQDVLSSEKGQLFVYFLVMRIGDMNVTSEGNLRSLNAAAWRDGFTAAGRMSTS